MRVLKLIRLIAIPLGFTALLLASGSARADVAPPNDGGNVVDMSVAKDLSTVAKPDMTAAPTTDDGGCTMTTHGTPGAAALLAASAMGLLLVSRRKHSA